MPCPWDSISPSLLPVRSSSKIASQGAVCTRCSAQASPERSPQHAYSKRSFCAAACITFGKGREQEVAAIMCKSSFERFLMSASFQQRAFNAYVRIQFSDNGIAKAGIGDLQHPQASACARDPAPSLDALILLNHPPYGLEDCVRQCDDARHVAGSNCWCCVGLCLD